MPCRDECIARFKNLYGISSTVQTPFLQKTALALGGETFKFTANVAQIDQRLI